MSSVRVVPPEPVVTEPVPFFIRFAPLIFLLLWSGGFPVGKIGLQYTGPMTFLAVRYVLVILLMIPVLLITRPALPRGRAWLHLAIVGLLVQGLYFGLGYAALALGVSAGAAALITALQPILTGLLAPRLSGEAISPRAWLGLALGLAGATVVILARNGAGFAQTSTLGILTAFSALLAMTAGQFYEKRFGIAQHPAPANIVQHGVALLAFLPLAWFTEGFAIEPSWQLSAALAYLVIGNSVIAIGLLLAMIRRGKVSRVSALFFLTPPLAAILAWFLLGEAMPPLAWVGFALAAVGVGLASGVLPARRSQPLPPDPA